ncbi:MAG TPA: ATP-binding protein [Planctomycetaceae bacterium]|nr:ATP-binding protein [Planctomycetaceae bacterium]
MKSRLGQALRHHTGATSWTMILARYALAGLVSIALGAILKHELAAIPYGNVVAFFGLAFVAWYCGPGPALLEIPELLLGGQLRQFATTGVFAWPDLNAEQIGSATVMEVILFVVGLSGLLRRASQQLARRQAEQLREQDRRKDQFLATLAHELRNPLAPVRTGLDLLQLAAAGTPDPALVSEVHDMMRRQIDHMVRLIDDLLDVSRITTGKFELRKQRIELADVVRDAVESARPAIDEAGHRLTVAVPGVPLVLEADGTRLSQVFTNLLNNACKFTDRGGDITLTVEPRGREVEIRVRDTGIGIAPEMLPRIFEMFVQPQNPVTRTHGGLGIGLSLVRTMVEMHGGRVEASSHGAGQGSEFVVRLPLVIEPADDGKESRGTSACNGDAVTHRILIVDDNRDAARSLAHLLEASGHACRIEFDGRSALCAAADFRPNLCVLDIGMPGMSGYELASRLRANPKLQSATLIALTGWGQDEDFQRSQLAGFDHHLVKPVTAAALNALISQSASANTVGADTTGAKG